MKAYRKAIVPLFCLLLAVVVACGSDGTYMRQQLAELQDKNLADSLLTNDSLALNLCEYFDNHGTSNEKMLAHYLLGRTYADMGEAPRALDCYYDAISLADTTAADCDYHTLIGVYGQMSVIFHQQNLPQDEIQAIKQYAYYTLLLGDTINHIIYQSQLIAPYYLLDEKDTVLQIIEDVNQQLEQRGCTEFPPLNLGTAAYIYTERGDLEKASEMLDKYESIDGMIDENHNIAAGWESYYWIKGLYELKIENIDSAEYYFRKALPVNDIEVRFNAYKGLLKVYQLRQNIDSIANYSLLYENSLDSLHNRMRTDAISQSAALYGYTRSEKLIEQETQKRREAWYWFFGLLVCGLLATGFGVLRYHNNQKEKRLIINQLRVAIATSKAEQQHVKTELENLKSKKYEEVIDKMEKKERILNQHIAELQQKIGRFNDTNLENNFESFWNSQIVGVFAKKSQFTKEHPIPNKAEWSLLVYQLKRDMPLFYRFLFDGKKLSTLELHTCILVLLDYDEGVIAGLTESSSSAISIAKGRANMKMFNEKGAITLKYNLKKLI
jgi:hypothetical protein